MLLDWLFGEGPMPISLSCCGVNVFLNYDNFAVVARVVVVHGFLSGVWGCMPLVFGKIFVGRWHSVLILQFVEELMVNVIFEKGARH